jgi:hypothetical protein
MMGGMLMLRRVDGRVLLRGCFLGGFCLDGATKRRFYIQSQQHSQGGS